MQIYRKVYLDIAGNLLLMLPDILKFQAISGFIN